MKEIHPLSYIFLEWLWNDYFILVCYKFHSITASMNEIDLMSCDVKKLVVRLMCLSMYLLHTTVIGKYISRGKMIPKIIFILFVNLRMDSPANALLASKERLDLLENDLVYQTHLSQI